MVIVFSNNNSKNEENYIIVIYMYKVKICFYSLDLNFRRHNSLIGLKVSNYVDENAEKAQQIRLVVFFTSKSLLELHNYI